MSKEQFVGGRPGFRHPVFQISAKEYSQRRRDSVPSGADLTAYNKRKLSKAGIWYTGKEVNGTYCLCVLPEDLEKIQVKQKPARPISRTLRVIS